MKYLALSDRFVADHPGGSYRVAWELALLLRNAGHECSMLCGSIEGDPAPGKEVVDGVEIIRYRLPTGRFWDPRRPQRIAAGVREAFLMHFASAQFDVVHGHSPVSARAVWDTLPVQTRRQYTVHSPAPMEQRINWATRNVLGMAKVAVGVPYFRRLELLTLRRADSIHCLSDYTRGLLKALYGDAVSSKVRVIPWWTGSMAFNVSKAEARRALGWPLDGFIAFTARRLVARMGIDLLIEAFDDPDIRRESRLHIAGEGPDRARLEANAARRMLGGRVTFTGRLTDAQLTLAYQAADCFVLPSRQLECFGLVLLEALAHGCPVLASNVGAVPAVLAGIDGAFLFESGSSASLASLLRKFEGGDLEIPDGAEIAESAKRKFARNEIRQKYVEHLAS